MALRLACHDAAVHRRLAPEAGPARAVFDAVEQARVEAIGARRMAGVAGNLAAMLEDRYHRGGKYEDITDRADAPLEDAVALMVRERLTGREAAARRRAKIVDLWRDFDRGAGRARPRRPARRRHREPARLRAARCATCSPRSTWPTIDADRRGGGRGRGQPRRAQDQQQAEGEAEQRVAGRSRRDRDRRRGESTTCEEGATRSRRRALRRDARRSRGRRCRGGRRSPGVRRSRANERRGPGLQGLHHEVRRDRPRRGAVRRRGADAAARLSRQAARRTCRAWSARLANRLQRRLMAQQNRAWEFDLEEGMLDPARLPRIVIDPYPAALVQAGAGHRFPRHGGDAAARQFRLDARPADHGRGDLRRHPGAHAGALRRQGRDPRLHHARLEGRAVARGVAAGRQARQSRPAQRPAPHHLQVRRRAVAARAQESRPDDARGAAQGEHRRRGARLGAQAPARRGPSSGAS